MIYKVKLLYFGGNSGSSFEKIKHVISWELPSPSAYSVAVEWFSRMYFDVLNFR